MFRSENTRESQSWNGDIQRLAPTFDQPAF